MTYVYYEQELVCVANSIDEANDFVDAMLRVFDRNRYDYEIEEVNKINYDSDIKKQRYLKMKIELLKSQDKDIEKEANELLLIENRINIVQDQLNQKYGRQLTKGAVYNGTIK